MNVYPYLFVGWLVVFVFNNVLLYMESISDLTIRWLTKLKYMQLKSFFIEYQIFFQRISKFFSRTISVFAAARSLYVAWTSFCNVSASRFQSTTEIPSL